MSKKILGIACFYHNASATLMVDGQIVAAASEESFTRKKHDPNFPINAIRYCLKEGNIQVSDLDLIAFYDNPKKKFQRIIQTHIDYAPQGFDRFAQVVREWVFKKLNIQALIQKELNCSVKVVCFDHHESHAASAFFPSPFEKAAFLTIDGVGEWATASYGVGNQNKIEILKELHFPNSLGLLYSTFTGFLGFKVNSGEYKVMGLAPYGEAKYTRQILDNLIDLKDDGSFLMNMKYFDFCTKNRMFSDKFIELFGAPRKAETKLTQRDMDLAKSIQVVSEEIVMRMVKHIRQVTQERYLCLSGGVALNCVINGKILKSKIFDDIWIQPASGDSGGSLGAAYMAHCHYFKGQLPPKNGEDLQRGSYLGSSHDNAAIEAYLKKEGAVYERYDDAALVDRVADLLTKEMVVGWFSGRMEFGPRALGGRSILGDPRSTQMQKTMNLKIKFRESFRPFAPAIMQEKVGDWFEIDAKSPYMLTVVNVKKERCRALSAEEAKLQGLSKLNSIRSEVPAITHVDYSARLQTVSARQSPLFYQLLKSFYEKTQCPMLINTSFNVRGEPIVESPEQAYTCFMRTNMDVLVLGNFLLYRKQQPKFEDHVEWQKEFELD